MLIPQLIQSNPDLAYRVSSDWKENGYSADRYTQLAAFSVIAGLCIYAPQNYGILSIVGCAYLMRALSSLLGYFDLGQTPVL